MHISIEDQADAWIALHRYRDFDDAPGELFERGFRLNEFAYDEPAFAWSVIQDIVGRYSESDLFNDVQTEAKQVLSNLGAGPLETLLAENGAQLISEIEAVAKNDRRCFWTLACVWRNGMPDEFWDRIQRITGGFSP